MNETNKHDATLELTYQKLGLQLGRGYYKYELAEAIGIHVRTLARYLMLIEEQLAKISPYSRRKQILSPRQVEFSLRHLGYL